MRFACSARYVCVFCVVQVLRALRVMKQHAQQVVLRGALPDGKVPSVDNGICIGKCMYIPLSDLNKTRHGKENAHNQS